MSLAPITGDGGKLAAQAADQTQKTTPVQEFQGILKNGLNAIKEDMDSIFEEASALYQIPSKLLRAVAKAESGFNPKAVSKAGAMGVMQLMPGTARSLGVSDPYNARQNILGGAKYLKQNLDRFGGDVSLALAAYNAGLLWSSFFVTLVAKKIVLINLCCRPCFIWGSITIITVWTNMIIINVCKFFYLLIECFLCCKLIQICAFILQGIEITLHRCIVVRISCFAHALCHIYRFAEFGKCFGRIL